MIGYDVLTAFEDFVKEKNIFLVRDVNGVLMTNNFNGRKFFMTYEDVEGFYKRTLDPNRKEEWVVEVRG